MRTHWLLLAALLAGCLFRDPVETHFFRPESAALDGGSTTQPSATAQAVRLRPVSGTPFLRERIVWRQSEVEYGLYEERRWSELPASYVQRALETALRQTARLRLTDDFRAPSLQVDLIAFDEVIAPAHLASVSLVVTLRDREQHHLLDRSFSAEAPIASNTPSETAVAMGRALDEVVTQVATAVSTTLGAPRPKRRSAN